MVKGRHRAKWWQQSYNKDRPGVQMQNLQDILNASIPPINLKHFPLHESNLYDVGNGDYLDPYGG